MIKQAYGVGDDFDYIDRIPYDQLAGSDKKELIKYLKKRLSSLNKDYTDRLYDNEAYAGYRPDIFVSQHKLHEDDYGVPNELSLSSYNDLVNKALKSKNLGELENAASYWSMRGTISDPKARKAIKKALEKYRKEHPDR